MNEHEHDQPTTEAPDGVVREGTPAEGAETADIQAMYEELGIKATAPTGKPKGRPKASKVRAKDADKEDNADSDEGRQSRDSQSKPKATPDTDKDGVAGDEDNKAKSKERKSDREVSDEPEEAGEGVRDPKSKSDKDSKSGGEADADGSDERDGEDSSQPKEPKEEQDDSEDGENPGGKRPGKSNPEVERRFQKMTSDIREREERIAALERQLQETTTRHQEAQIAQEDPEYTVEDFLKVRDEDGNIIDLDQDQAELHWRRWKEGYEQRGVERQAEIQRQQAYEQQQRETSERLMQSSVEAYDTLTSIRDTNPELNPQSPEFDQELSDAIVPIIEEAIIYQPGTEPGNQSGHQPVIVGMKMNPQRILEVVTMVRNQKRSLPLNGVNDNVEVRSNVNVQHGRSSDPTVKAANELYKELGINKRI